MLFICVFSFTVGVDYSGCVVVSVCVRVFFYMFVCFVVALFFDIGDNISFCFSILVIIFLVLLLLTAMAVVVVPAAVVVVVVGISVL